MGRRGIAILLSLTMLMGALPGWAMAAEGSADSVVWVEGGTADLEEAVGAAIDAAGKDKAPAVEVRVSLPTELEELALTLPVAALETLGGAGGSLTVTSALADVTMDSDMLEAIANQAAGDTAELTVAPVSVGRLSDRQRQIVNGTPVYELLLVSGGRELHTFGGGSLTVTLPYELPVEQKAAGVVVWSMDEYNRLTDCETSCDAAGGTVTFVTRHLSWYVIGYEEPMEMPFTDVSKAYWAYSEIDWAYGKGLMTGVSANAFRPEGTVTRQQVWMALSRLSGAAPATMAEARDWAVKSGITDGSAPGAAVTRQQLVALLYRYAERMGYAVNGRASLSGYPDADALSAYAVEPMAWAVGNNVISGSGEGELNPEATATRAQFAAILWRFWSVAV